MQISDEYSPLELTPEQLQGDVEQVLAYLARHLDTLNEQTAWELASANAGEVAPREAIPRQSSEIETILDDFFNKRVNPSYNPSCGGYLAYVPGGGLPHAAIADLMSGILNKFVTLWQVAPGFANIEADVVRWFTQLIGYTDVSGGYLTTGGSMANWSAIVTARRIKLPDNFLDGIIYTTAQAHHSVTKAAVLAGFPEANIRIIDTINWSLDLQSLQKQVKLDSEAGCQPFLVVANAGTTNTGAIDNLEAIADFCSSQNLWLHTDAAYGGFFMLTERGRACLQGIELSDSITLDPHKGLFLPYGTGCLLVKDVTHLEEAHKVTAKYLPPFQQDADRVDFCGISPELSRDFRGLRVWLPFKLFGAETFTAYLDEKLDLCQHAFASISHLEHIEVLAAPELSTFAFRFNPAGETLAPEQLNELNREFLTELNRSKRFLLSATYLDDVFAIRVCVLSFRTHLSHVDCVIDEVCRVTSRFADRDLT